MKEILEILLLIIIPLMGFLYNRHRKLRVYYEIMWKKSSSLKPNEILGLRGYERYGFKKKYFQGKEYESVRKKIRESKNVLIIGNPLSGKSRIIYQVLVSLEKSCDVTVPRPVDIKPEDFRIPHQITFWRKRVLVLDDVDKFAQKENFRHLLQEFEKRNTIIFASCREGPEYTLLCEEMEYELCMFEDVYLNKISKSKGEEIAGKTGICLPSRFDGNIGSLFVPLDTMNERFGKCTDIEKGILRSIKRLYYAGIYEEREIFSKKKLKYICKKKEEIQKREYEWPDLFDKLETKGFIEIIDKDQIRAEKAYLERVIEDKTLERGIAILEEMMSLFSNDNEVLINIGKKALQMEVAGIPKAEYIKVATKVFEEALKVMTPKPFPTRYAATQNYLGIAYGLLSKEENKIENCNKATKAFEEALKVYTKDEFPRIHRIIESNLEYVEES